LIEKKNGGTWVLTEVEGVPSEGKEQLEADTECDQSIYFQERVFKNRLERKQCKGGRGVGFLKRTVLRRVWPIGIGVVEKKEAVRDLGGERKKTKTRRMGFRQKQVWLTSQLKIYEVGLGGKKWGGEKV